MNADDRGFTAKPILARVYEACGPSDFGYRMQAIFAHVLLRIGASVTEVNAKGHPDIKAVFQGHELLIQVKTLLHNNARSSFTLSRDDLKGISSDGRHHGYLAILDCAMPVAWIVIPEDKARHFVGQPTLVASLQAERIEPLSSACTDVFLDLVIEESERLSLLQFKVAAQRAIRCEPL